jgi:hypothetical protein
MPRNGARAPSAADEVTALEDTENSLVAYSTGQEQSKGLTMHASDAPQRIALYFPPISALISLELRVFTGTVHTSPPISWVIRTDPASLVDI